MEATARRRTRRIGNLARQRLGQEAAPVRTRHRADQRFACTGCSGSDQSGRVGPVSTITPEVHHRDDVGDVADDREVVRDQEQAEREPARQVDEEVRDLRLRRRVERGERLVEHEHGGICRERAGDRDPLALAAAELVRIARGGARRQADELEQLGDAGAAIPRRDAAEHSERVGEL